MTYKVSVITLTLWRSALAQILHNLDAQKHI